MWVKTGPKIINIKKNFCLLLWPKNFLLLLPTFLIWQNICGNNFVSLACLFPVCFCHRNGPLSSCWSCVSAIFNFCEIIANTELCIIKSNDYLSTPFSQFWAGAPPFVVVYFCFFFLSFFEGGVRRGPIKNGSKYACLAPRISPPPVCVCVCVYACVYCCSPWKWHWK